ncbi:cytochrome c peroxidase [Novosphingobium sp. PhB57]|uniref:cytochrome-c peroxidase n=1 Tax=Novosphingobium sp. PhB57 TaxID=2485107 RepID=UPI0010429107|nr:cytochrome c peroxidase [Novosphingobium sp. PhB57]TCU58030.1 cytochrome c peroxidase [Novosphingobium sp. PhB57]
MSGFRLLPRFVLTLAILAVGGSVVGRAQQAGGEGVPAVGALRALYAGGPATWPRPRLGEGARFTEFGPLPRLPEASLREQALAEIGRRMFDDPALSRSGQIACASCHSPELGLADGLRTAFGHDRQRGRRNAQSLYAAAWMTPLFWDGRAATLEEQALHPLLDGKEMAGSARLIEPRINRDKDYRAAFRELNGHRRVTLQDAAAAIAAFERALRPPRSRWSRVMERGVSVLTDQELAGLHLFRTRAGCAACHNGPLLSDGQFHNLGISFYGRSREDLGRYEVTRDPADVGRFRTPSLLGVSRSAPYMHNGLFPTLENVVELYDGGGGRDRARRMGEAPAPIPDPLVSKLGLTRDEQAALAAFLRTL